MFLTPARLAGVAGRLEPFRPADLRHPHRAGDRDRGRLAARYSAACRARVAQHDARYIEGSSEAKRRVVDLVWGEGTRRPPRAEDGFTPQHDGMEAAQ